jgi:TonB-dependent SusC/RagA subfamily outer membrane receptor
MKSTIVLVLIISFCSIQANFAQTQNKKKIKISGIVTDANMKPVSGVIIFIDKVKTNSTTNSKGIYQVKVSPSAKEISVFSQLNGVGKIEINGKTEINFKLDAFNSNSTKPAKKEEETVEIGYGKVNKESLTTPVNKIKGQQTRYLSYSSIYEMIRGEVPGVEVIGKSIKIQNSFSYQLSTEPLFVVDGIIVPQIDGISPLDVKSIEILKGSSASVYGARGANGVILITLISGKDK